MPTIWTPRALIAGLCVLSSTCTYGQTLESLATRDVFLIAPSTALPPFSPPSDRWGYGAQFGIWLDDWTRAFHTNIGISGTSPFTMLGPAGAITTTLVYIGGPCRGCDGWVGGRVDGQRRLVGRTAAQFSFGRAARLASAGSATSVAIWTPIRFSNVTLTPGLVAAGVSTVHQRQHSVRPVVSAMFHHHWDLISLNLAVRLLAPGGGPALIATEFRRPD